MNQFLTTTQRQELLGELSLENNRRFADRIRVILLLDEGRQIKHIAAFLFLDEGTVRNWRKRYKDGGVEKLLNDHYVGRTCLLDEDQLSKLSAELSSQVYPTTRSVIDYVFSTFGIKYSTGGMTDLLHRLGFSYKKPKGVPAKADKLEQQKFINRYNGVKIHGPVYFGDSTHPMLNPVLSAGWVKKGEDAFVKTNSGRQRVNINGAIDILSKDVITRSCETVNQGSIRELLRAIRRKNPTEKHLYLVLDNARYNHSKSVRGLAKEIGIKILYLPPYSPNLNPIERLWKFMKKKMIANRQYETIDEFRQALSEFFRGIRKYRSELETLITDNFQVVQP